MPLTRLLVIAVLALAVAGAIAPAHGAATLFCSPTPGVPAAQDVAYGNCLFTSPIMFGQDPLGPSPACSTCHYPPINFRDGGTHYNILQTTGGQTVEVLRKTPSLFNVSQTGPYSWDGRNLTLQDQILSAIKNPLEINGTGATSQQLAALVAYLGTITPPQRPYDKYLAGDSTALSSQALAGKDIFFGKGTCSTCHVPPLFTNNALAMNQRNATFSGSTDMGAGYVGTGPNLNFNVPQLRAISLLPPYMHDGGLGTLEQVIRFYNRSFSLNLTLTDMVNLLAFLMAL